MGQELSPAHARTNQTRQRMADISGSDPMPAEKLFLKRKYAQQTVDHAAHLRQSALAPRPGLRSHQIDHRDGPARKLFDESGHAQVKIGAIGQDGGAGMPDSNSTAQFSVFAIDARDVKQYLKKTHHRQTRGIHHRLYAFALHTSTGAAEELRIRKTNFERRHQTGSVQVSRSFSCGNQNAESHLLLVYCEFTAT